MFNEDSPKKARIYLAAECLTLENLKKKSLNFQHSLNY